MSLKVFLWALTTEPEDAAASDPAQQRAQSQDEWVFRKEGVIWSSDQETSEEMRSGIRNTDRVTVLRETLAAAARRRVAVDAMPPLLSPPPSAPARNVPSLHSFGIPEKGRFHGCGIQAISSSQRSKVSVGRPGQALAFRVSAEDVFLAT